MQRIGIFDSGLGGLTVAAEITKAFPNRDLVYFGDTARVPYGEKSESTLIRYSLEIAAFLQQQGIDLLVVACNSASAAALSTLQHHLTMPVIGVVEPGVEAALKVSKRLGIVGTRRTITSRIYEQECSRRQTDLFLVTKPCPFLVPLAEEGWVEGRVTHLVLEEYLDPFIKAKIDTLLLGCTHYPVFTSVIQEIIGPDVKIISSARAVAEALPIDKQGDREGELQCFVSDDPVKFQKQSNLFFGRKIQTVELIRLPVALGDVDAALRRYMPPPNIPQQSRSQ